MSIADRALIDSPRPSRRQEPSAPERRGLRLVDAPAVRRRPRTLYAVVALLGVALIVGAQIALSMLTTQDSYRVADLMQERRDLTLEAQQLEDDIAGLASPQYLAANAASLGMVIDSTPGYLRLSDGRITGDTAPASEGSTVDAKRAQVGNALVSDTPLATDQDRSLTGTIKKKQKASDSAANGEEQGAAPPSIDDGLPSPQTH